MEKEVLVNVRLRKRVSSLLFCVALCEVSLEQKKSKNCKLIILRGVSFAVAGIDPVLHVFKFI